MRSVIVEMLPVGLLVCGLVILLVCGLVVLLVCCGFNV